LFREWNRTADPVMTEAPVLKSLRMRTPALRHRAGSTRTHCRQGLRFCAEFSIQNPILPANPPSEQRLFAADRRSSRCNTEALSAFSLFNVDCVCLLPRSLEVIQPLDPAIASPQGARVHLELCSL
jgi:hypothetical protein